MHDSVYDSVYEKLYKNLKVPKSCMNALGNAWLIRVMTVGGH